MRSTRGVRDHPPGVLHRHLPLDLLQEGMGRGRTRLPLRLRVRLLGMPAGRERGGVRGRSSIQVRLEITN